MSSGGLRGYYVTGANIILSELRRLKEIKVRVHEHALPVKDADTQNTNTQKIARPLDPNDKTVRLNGLQELLLAHGIGNSAYIAPEIPIP